VSRAAVIHFSEEPCLDVRVAGGKGSSLARMLAAGLPVPPGFVVPADALERAVDADELRRLARELRHADAQALVLASGSRLAEVEVAYAELGAGPVAVRSSACAEDSEAASYAGQQETFLHVEGGAAVRARVVDCWASFFSERALFYRSHKGSLEDLAMAVVVQRMVDAEKAGVLFTANPVNARRDELVVEAVFGLGEQVVSGEVTPDHYVLDRAGARKRDRLANGGVLGDDELLALAELGQQLESHFGSPQDVEWAIADGTLWLLQSRPVTTL
jgi:pyruvate,water dikinase